MQSELPVNGEHKTTENHDLSSTRCICRPRVSKNENRKRYLRHSKQVRSKVSEDRHKSKEVCKIRISAADLCTYPLCPTCQMPMEREYVNYCSYCGQKLSWKQYCYGHIEVEQSGLGARTPTEAGHSAAQDLAIK